MGRKKNVANDKVLIDIRNEKWLQGIKGYDYFTCKYPNYLLKSIFACNSSGLYGARITVRDRDDSIMIRDFQSVDDALCVWNNLGNMLVSEEVLLNLGFTYE